MMHEPNPYTQPDSGAIPHQPAALRPEDTPGSPEQPVLTLGEAVGQFKSLIAEQDEHFEAIFNGPGGEFQGLKVDDNPVDDSPIQKIFGEVNAAMPGADLQSIYLAVRGRLADVLMPERFTATVPHVDHFIALEGQLKALRGQYGETAAAHYDATLKQALANVDWGRMIELVAADTWPEHAPMTKAEAADLLASSVIRRPFDGADLDDLYQQASAVQAFTQLADDLDATLDTPLPAPEDGWFVHGNVVPALRSWGALTQKVVLYTSNIRREGIKGLGRDEVFRLIRLAGRLRMDGSEAGGVPAPILAAYKRYAAKQLQALDEQEAHLQHQRLHGLPNALYIGTAHRNELAKTAGITDVPEWIRRRLRLFGPRLSSGIGFIEFTDVSPKTHSHNDSDAKAVITTGERVVDENKLLIDIRKFDGPDRSPRAVRHSIEATLDHEIAHHMHHATLTVAELRQWQKALEAEPDLNMTDYVRDLVEEEAPEAQLLREQFAISVSLFMNDPLRVALDYPQRFAVLNGFTGRYRPEAIESLIAPIRTLRANGKHHDANIRLKAAKILYE